MVVRFSRAPQPSGQSMERMGQSSTSCWTCSHACSRSTSQPSFEQRTVRFGHSLVSWGTRLARSSNRPHPQQHGTLATAAPRRATTRPKLPCLNWSITVMASWCLAALAQSSAVFPSLSFTPRSAPASSKNRTLRCFPSMAAQMSAVRPEQTQKEKREKRRKSRKRKKRTHTEACVVVFCFFFGGGGGKADIWGPFKGVLRPHIEPLDERFAFVCRSSGRSPTAAAVECMYSLLEFQ
mmetsp:Transcript_10440/g.24233  ORF Transcript_10440/g.24233 Transcript_10440/m.24233 type:complete len:237 (-) Transcript_10440:102-812(-)